MMSIICSWRAVRRRPRPFCALTWSIACCSIAPPILVGNGRILPDIGVSDLAAAHGRWALQDARRLGSDRVEVYERGKGSAAAGKSGNRFSAPMKRPQ